MFHPEVEVYDVTDEEGKAVGMLYLDFFPRETKQSGAWMTSFRGQYIDGSGNDVRPHVTLTMNFTRPTATKPSLLTVREVETFMHEFGHALHLLLSRCKYSSLSGTSVYRDFVEVPSQFNENYVYEREFLDSFACHYLTGEPVPQELIDKLLASSQYGAAYACVRQLGFGFIDMAWHSITAPYEGDDFTFEYNAVKQVQALNPSRAASCRRSSPTSSRAAMLRVITATSGPRLSSVTHFHALRRKASLTARRRARGSSMCSRAAEPSPDDALPPIPRPRTPH